MPVLDDGFTKSPKV